VQEVYTLSI